MSGEVVAVDCFTPMFSEAFSFFRYRLGNSDTFLSLYCQPGHFTLEMGNTNGGKRGRKSSMKFQNLVECSSCCTPMGTQILLGSPSS